MGFTSSWSRGWLSYASVRTAATIAFWFEHKGSGFQRRWTIGHSLRTGLDLYSQSVSTHVKSFMFRTWKSTAWFYTPLCTCYAEFSPGFLWSRFAFFELCWSLKVENIWFFLFTFRYNKFRHCTVKTLR